MLIKLNLNKKKHNKNNHQVSCHSKLKKTKKKVEENLIWVEISWFENLNTLRLGAFQHPSIDVPCSGASVGGHNGLEIPLGSLTQIKPLSGSGLFYSSWSEDSWFASLRGSVSLTRTS